MKHNIISHLVVFFFNTPHPTFFNLVYIASAMFHWRQR